MNDEQWLNSLEVGDEVCYYSRWSDFKITKIAKITPTRQIKTDDGKTFKHGYCRVDTWDGYHLQEVTDNIRDSILKGKLVGIMSSVKWDQVPLGKLKQIKDILMRQDIGTTE